MLILCDREPDGVSFHIDFVRGTELNRQPSSRPRRIRAISVAAASATALVAGLVVTPAAAWGGAASAAQTATSETLTESDASTAQNWITLVTGDRIAVDGEGAPVSVERPAGRHLRVRRCGASRSPRWDS